MGALVRDFKNLIEKFFELEFMISDLGKTIIETTCASAKSISMYPRSRELLAQ